MSRNDKVYEVKVRIVRTTVFGVPVRAGSERTARRVAREFAIQALDPSPHDGDATYEAGSAVECRELTEAGEYADDLPWYAGYGYANAYDPEYDDMTVGKLLKRRQGAKP